MTELQKEYCEEKGLIYIKPENTEISDYVNWLEDQILALRIHDVVNRRELLVAFLEWFKGYCDLDVTPNEEDIDLFLSN